MAKFSTQYCGRGTMKWSNVQKMRAFQSFKPNLEGLFAHTNALSPLETSYDSIVDEPPIKLPRFQVGDLWCKPSYFPLALPR
jgi:hypothetical protein